MKVFVHVAIASLLLTGCASSTSPPADTGEAATALRKAAEKTLAVDSFHADSTIQLPSGSGRATVDYQAPDRERERFGAGEDAHEAIRLGGTVYFTALDKPGYFWKFEGHGSGASDTLMYLQFLEHAVNVRLDGNLYRFDTPPSPGGPAEGPATGVATLSDEGFINTLLYHYQIVGDEVSVGFTYSRYNSGITIEPPPQDLIAKQPPLVACPSPMPPASGVLPNGLDFCDVITPSPDGQ